MHGNMFIGMRHPRNYVELLKSDHFPRSYENNALTFKDPGPGKSGVGF